MTSKAIVGYLVAAFAAIATLITAVSGVPARDPSAAQTTAGAVAADNPATTGWALDVDAFVAHLEATHPDPYHSVSRQEFMTAVMDFKTEVPNLTEWEARARFMELLTLLSRAGQEGHMVLRPMDTDTVEWRMLPLELYWFPDGVYVVAGHSDDAAGLVGAKVTAIGGNPVMDLLEKLETLATKDNEWTLRARLPTLLTMPDLIAALGIEDSTTVQLLADGQRLQKSLTPITMDAFLERSGRMHPFVARLPRRKGHIWLTRQADSVWVRYLKRHDALYIGFNLVRGPFEDEVTAIEKLMRSQHPERVVVDIRNNPGGETGHYVPLLRALADPPVDRPGGLFILTGRVTFSAAANFLGDLDRDACALVVGEPPGAAPRFWNDNDPFTLPYSGLEVGVAERWWDQGGPEHPGTTFSVDMPVEMTARDFFSGLDPVLRAALAGPVSARCS